MAKSSMKLGSIPGGGIEQAVVADDRPSPSVHVLTAEKPTIWWKKPYVGALVAAVLLLMLAGLIAAIALQMNQQNDSNAGAPINTNTTADEDAGQAVSGPTMAPTSAEAPPPFAFYVMGDVPYDLTESAILEEQLSNMTVNRHPGSEFAVHVGDFQRWQQSLCSSDAYRDFRALLLQSPVPVLVLSGDNDYIDCPDPVDAWDHFLDNFSELEKNWTNRLPVGIDELEVNRWEERPEMFSFVRDGVLFMSSNLLNVPEEERDEKEWNSRMADSAAWVQNESESAFSQYDIRGVVMFSHATPSHLVKEVYKSIFEAVFARRPELPVLNLHGDGHVFNVDRKFDIVSEWTGLVDIQVDQGGNADPLLVEVAPMRNGEMKPFAEENEMQYVFGDGLFRIDRQKGRYPDTSGG